MTEDDSTYSQISGKMYEFIEVNEDLAKTDDHVRQQIKEAHRWMHHWRNLEFTDGTIDKTHAAMWDFINDFTPCDFVEGRYDQLVTFGSF